MKVALLVLYFAVLIGIGLYCRKHATDVDGFVLGGRNVGPWLTAFAYGTSYFSAVVFVGYAGQFGWKYGIAATWAGIGNALIGSLMAWFILGRRTRIMTRHLDTATMPQFFEKRFGSPSLKIGAAIIIFIFMIPYTASLYNGLSRLFGMAFSIDYSVCILLMAVLTAIYVIAGGYMATAINDFIQGVVMLVGISAVIYAVLESKGGFVAALDGLARITDDKVSATPGIFASFFGTDPLNLLFVVILTSLGTWGSEVLRDKKRTGYSKGHSHFNFVCIRRSGRLLFLRRLWQIIFRPNRHQSERLRLDYPDNVKRAIGRNDCACCHFSFIGVNVNAVVIGNRFGLDLNA